MSAPIVAVVGGGQLARMMQEAANALGIHVRALVEAEDGATAQVVPDSRVGDPSDDAAMDWLVDGADVLTFEHEHIPPATLQRLSGRLPIEPSGQALVYAQDKIAMRTRLTELGIPCPQWFTFHTQEELEEKGSVLGFPLVVKWARDGYDGHGVRRIDSADQADDWIRDLAPGHELLAEAAVPFTRELAVLVARRRSGELVHWPVMETVQENGVCSIVEAPARNFDPDLARRALDIGTRIATELDVTGILAVEMFVCENQDSDSPLLVNELAMRPHNSGHWTIDGAVTSQFENHLRAVLDLPLGDTSLTAPASCMVNLLGSDLSEPRDAYPRVMARYPHAKIHYYGKGVRPGRKLGHVTVTGSDMETCRSQGEGAVALLRGTDS